MTELEKQVRRVCRRLNFQKFLDILVWCWVAALVVDLCWVAAEKYWQPLIEPWWIGTLAALGLGTVVAGLIAVFTRRSPVEAAMALDQAFGLKERVSSTMTLPEELRESSAGIALITDTAKRVETIDVGEKFGFQIPRTAWVPLLPALLVFLVATFVNLAKSGIVQAKPSSDDERKQVQESTKVLAKRLEQQKEIGRAHV